MRWYDWYFYRIGLLLAYGRHCPTMHPWRGSRATLAGSLSEKSPMVLAPLAARLPLTDGPQLLIKTRSAHCKNP